MYVQTGVGGGPPFKAGKSPLVKNGSMHRAPLDGIYFGRCFRQDTFAMQR